MPPRPAAACLTIACHTGFTKLTAPDGTQGCYKCTSIKIKPLTGDNFGQCYLSCPAGQVGKDTGCYGCPEGSSMVGSCGSAVLGRLADLPRPLLRARLCSQAVSTSRNPAPSAGSCNMLHADVALEPAAPAAQRHLPAEVQVGREDRQGLLRAQSAGREVPTAGRGHGPGLGARAGAGRKGRPQKILHGALPRCSPQVPQARQACQGDCRVF
jgi:hypothetical protein